MAIRTTRRQVTFQSPFSLAELDGLQPGGTYDVDTEEEIIEGNERTVYLRMATLIYIASPSSTRTVTINPVGLEAALQRDASIGVGDSRWQGTTQAISEC